jgi:4,5-dihydroxyphthalate decarboxylase
VANLQLSLACTNNPRTRPLIDGRIKPAGIDLQITTLGASEMFWRQLHFEEFDVSEMSMSSLMIAIAGGDERWVGLPVFTSRRFFHTGILVRSEAGIEAPAGLKGKRIGVPEYQQTAALWTRAVLKDQYGVRPQDFSSWMERSEEMSHGGATGFKPPAGVDFHYIPPDQSIGSMLLSGELDATLMYIAGGNAIDRSRADVRSDPRVRPLFADARAEGLAYYGKTGYFPVNHGVVVRRRVYEENPWVVLNLFEAFVKAKELAAGELREQLGPYLDTGLVQATGFSPSKDLFPYGVNANRELLGYVAASSHDQGLTPRPVAVEEIFAPQTLNL